MSLFVKPLKDLKIVVFGTGAIGGSVGAWLLSYHDNIVFLDRGEIAESLRETGVTIYHNDTPDGKVNYSVQVIEDIKDAKDADVILLGVKNYSLEPVAKSIKEVMGDHPVIISMANGADNQEILPKYFSKVIYCIVSYNAWMDKPVEIGYQKKGPLIIGTPDNSNFEEMEKLAAYFSRGVETVVTDHLKDAVHSKIVINLTNSLTTLIGHGFKEISDFSLFHKLLPNTLYEGVKIVKAAGYKECKLGGMPPWILLWAGATLPRALTKGMFKKNVGKMVMSSMSQDILLRGGSDSEIESLTGYIVDLARRHNVPSPYNSAIYELCKENFAKPGFEPLDVTEVMARVEKNM